MQESAGYDRGDAHKLWITHCGGFQKTWPSVSLGVPIEAMFSVKE